MNVILLRVGIDTGCGGMAGPIFSDGSFEFIPIDCDQHVKGRTYGTLFGRHGGRKLIEYFPERFHLKMQDRFVHDDPEFKTFTYGDPTRPKQSLGYLEAGDLLVFYAGLCGWGKCATPTALYIVGYFKVQQGGLYPELVRKYSKGDVHETFAENYHIIHGDVHGRRYKRGSKSELVLVKGGPGSKLLNTAVQLQAQCNSAKHSPMGRRASHRVSQAFRFRLGLNVSKSRKFREVADDSQCSPFMNEKISLAALAAKSKRRSSVANSACPCIISAQPCRNFSLRLTAAR